MKPSCSFPFRMFDLFNHRSVVNQSWRSCLWLKCWAVLISYLEILSPPGYGSHGFCYSIASKLDSCLPLSIISFIELLFIGGNAGFLLSIVYLCPINKMLPPETDDAHQRWGPCRHLLHICKCKTCHVSIMFVHLSACLFSFIAKIWTKVAGMVP